MADTLADLKSVIADDLARTDLTTQIANEIEASIKRWQATRFWFNQTDDISFNTVASTANYTSSDSTYIPNILEFDLVTVEVNGSVYQVDAQNYSILRARQVTTTSTGQPQEYAYYGQELWLDPIPTSIYPVRISALYRLPTLGGDTSSNAWTIVADGRDLIRYDAEYRIYRSIIKDREAASDALTARNEELGRLASETTQRLATGAVTPTRW